MLNPDHYDSNLRYYENKMIAEELEEIVSIGTKGKIDRAVNTDGGEFHPGELHFSHPYSTVYHEEGGSRVSFLDVINSIPEDLLHQNQVQSVWIVGLSNNLAAEINLAQSHIAKHHNFVFFGKVPDNFEFPMVSIEFHPDEAEQITYTQTPYGLLPSWVIYGEGVFRFTEIFFINKFGKGVKYLDVYKFAGDNLKETLKELGFNECQLPHVTININEKDSTLEDLTEEDYERLQNTIVRYRQGFGLFADD